MYGCAQLAQLARDAVANANGLAANGTRYILTQAEPYEDTLSNLGDAFGDTRKDTVIGVIRSPGHMGDPPALAPVAHALLMPSVEDSDELGGFLIDSEEEEQFDASDHSVMLQPGASLLSFLIADSSVPVAVPACDSSVLVAAPACDSSVRVAVPACDSSVPVVAPARDSNIVAPAATASNVSACVMPAPTSSHSPQLYPPHEDAITSNAPSLTPITALDDVSDDDDWEEVECGIASPSAARAPSLPVHDAVLDTTVLTDLLDLAAHQPTDVTESPSPESLPDVLPSTESLHQAAIQDAEKIGYCVLFEVLAPLS